MWVSFQSQNHDLNLKDDDEIFFVKKQSEWMNQFILRENFTDNSQISR